MSIASISVYSLVSAIIYFNIGLLLIKLFRQNTDFLVQNSTTALITLLSFSLIRVFLPLDMLYAIVIQSKTIVPFINNILSIPISNRTNLGSLLLIIWILGTIITICRSLYIIIQESKKIKEYRIIDDKHIQTIAKQCLNGKAEVIISPDVEVPKAKGIKHAYIFMPLLKLTDEETKLILMHEYQHIVGRDAFIKLFYIFLKSIFWWNPIVHIFAYEVENLLELRCDSLLTKKMNDEERIKYLETILKVIKQSHLSHTKYIANTSSLVSYNTKGFTQQRFEIILNKAPSYSQHKRIRTMSIIVISFICSYFIILQPAYYPSIDEVEGHIIISEDNAHIIIDSNNTMQLYVDEELYGNLTKDELAIPPYSDLKIIRKDDNYE